MNCEPVTQLGEANFEPVTLSEGGGGGRGNGKRVVRQLSKRRDPGTARSYWVNEAVADNSRMHGTAAGLTHSLSKRLLDVVALVAEALDLVE